MVDTWATVGSCAQIGKNVHLSGGVGIGGVLEPLQANPTIIEDNCFIGARSEVVEGVIVGEGSVLSMGVFIGASTKIVDRATGKIHIGKVPPYSVVVSGTLPGKPLPERRAGPGPLLRGDRQDGRRADALQDQHQRAAAGLAIAGIGAALTVARPSRAMRSDRGPRPTVHTLHKRTLDPAEVIETIAALQRRIAERFPGAGLASVCAELHTIARENSARAEAISPPQPAAAHAIFLLLVGRSACGCCGSP